MYYVLSDIDFFYVQMLCNRITGLLKCIFLCVCVCMYVCMYIQNGCLSFVKWKQ